MHHQLQQATFSSKRSWYQVGGTYTRIDTSSKYSLINRVVAHAHYLHKKCMSPQPNLLDQQCKLNFTIDCTSRPSLSCLPSNKKMLFSAIVYNCNKRIFRQSPKCARAPPRHSTTPLAKYNKIIMNCRTIQCQCQCRLVPTFPKVVINDPTLVRAHTRTSIVVAAERDQNALSKLYKMQNKKRSD